MVRNTLASKEVLYDDIENPIKFKYFENLAKFQESGDFHLANKLNKKHIMWFKNKMNVKLAAQTFSESCATAFEQLSEDGNPDFLGCDATVKFCRIINQTFDLLNSRNLFAYGFKKPLNIYTAEVFFKFIDKTVDYLSKLKLTPNGRLLINTKVKTEFNGFIIDLQN